MSERCDNPKVHQRVGREDISCPPAWRVAFWKEGGNCLTVCPRLSGSDSRKVASDFMTPAEKNAKAIHALILESNRKAAKRGNSA